MCGLQGAETGFFRPRQDAPARKTRRLIPGEFFPLMAAGENRIMFAAYS